MSNVQNNLQEDTTNIHSHYVNSGGGEDNMNTNYSNSGEFYEDTEEYTEEDTDDDSDNYEYPTFNNIYTNMNEVECPYCRQTIGNYLYDEHIAFHLRELSQTAFSTLNQIVPPTLSSLFGLSNDGPFLSSTLVSSVVPSSMTSTPNTNTGIHGFSFSNLFNSSFQLVSDTLTFRGFTYSILDDDTFDDYEANLRLADMLGKVEVGVSDINKVSKIVNKDTVDDDTNCSICMDKIKNCEADCRELICSHQYCDTCITKWLSTSKKCPVCNIDLDERVSHVLK